MAPGPWQYVPSVAFTHTHTATNTTRLSVSSVCSKDSVRLEDVWSLIRSGANVNRGIYGRRLFTPRSGWRLSCESHLRVEVTKPLRTSETNFHVNKALWTLIVMIPRVVSTPPERMSMFFSLCWPCWPLCSWPLVQWRALRAHYELCLLMNVPDGVGSERGVKTTH